MPQEMSQEPDPVLAGITPGQKYKVGFLGGPCTGKTTLMNSVYETLRRQGLSVGIAPEFVSEDLKINGVPSFDILPYEQLRYYMHQKRIEQQALEDVDILLTDSPVFIGYFYTLFAQENHTWPTRHQLVIDDLRRAFEADAPHYDLLYQLAREFPYEDNGIRFHTEAQARRVDDIISTGMGSQRNLNFALLRGDVPTRTRQVLADMADYRPRARAL